MQLAVWEWDGARGAWTSRAAPFVAYVQRQHTHWAVTIATPHGPLTSATSFTRRQCAMDWAEARINMARMLPAVAPARRQVAVTLPVTIPPRLRSLLPLAPIAAVLRDLAAKIRFGPRSA